MGISVSKERRGIALISALIIAVFLVALTGAFMTVNQAHFAILRNSEDQTRSQRAAQAGLEWAFYNLEHDRRWGTTSTDDLPSRPGGASSTAFDDFKILETSNNFTKAEYTPMDAKLEITVENNLTVAPLPADEIDEALSLGEVPPEHARVRVVAEAGGSRHQAEALVRLAPLYQDTFYANGEVNVEADVEFTMASNDAFRNSVKATGDMYLPDIGGSKTRFTTPDDSALDSKGIIQANGEIYSQSAAGIEALDPADISKTGGRVMEEVKKKFSFFDLEPTDLPVAGESSQTPVTVASGEYRFTRSKAVSQFRESNGLGGYTIRERTADIDVLEYYANPGDTTPSGVFRSYQRLRDLGSGTQILDTTTFQYSDGTSIGVEDPNFVEADITSFVALDGGVPKAIPASDKGLYKVVINLDAQLLDVASGTQVVPEDTPGNSNDGTLQVTNKSGLYAETEGAAFVTPTVKLGDDGTDVSIRATGDVELSNAKTQGVGTIISEQGNISLKPIADSSFSVTGSNEGLALYAKKDVTVANPGQANWNFQGFVFAGDDFVFDANPKDDGNSYDVAFRGSVVAKNEDTSAGDEGISIKHGRRVKLIYEPEYLKFLNRNLNGPDGVPRDIALEYLYRKL